ncbi:MAG TPA: ABC transporter ATP-binding protein [Candidatus Hydrogenedentes bacterium]|nr:ABC transporter ATP-binding protein [Candidatus Hydrogenedentota bacterium]HOV74395.1 ABC transporter ATP-binding protein [Candidatus Hydrogenedentota bacterium]HPC16653.1 ABC transporter ATP-binding protein [Candidatus Hydrogenedentota bacterium]HRT21203.1 ABC transporter ATP-binding protein [Candidatus Hydrogenedentota bacterium]HRT65295.1 ABC transporter ATP-binding protein [Candidatus Hydrogenedentota bacterium]
MTDLAEPEYNTRNLLQARTSAWRIYRRLLGYAWKYKFRLLLSLFFAMVVASLFSSMILTIGGVIKLLYVDEATLAPQIDAAVARAEEMAGVVQRVTGWRPDNVEPRLRNLFTMLRANRPTALSYLALALVLISFSTGFARFLQEYFAGAIGVNVSITLGQEMYENTIGLSMPFFERRTTGEILARFTNDIFMVNRGLTMVCIRLFREPVKILFCLFLALSVNWRLTLTVLLVLPAIGYVIYAIGRKVKKSVQNSLQRIASMSGMVAETVGGIAIVKAYCMEAYEARRVHEELQRIRRYMTRMVKADAAIDPAAEFLMMVGLALFILMANNAFESGQIDGGGLVILFGALAAMMDPLRKLSGVNNMIQTSVASAERVFEFIDMKPDIIEAPNAPALPPLRESIRFDDVHFSYDGVTPVLKGISFEIRKGEMAALVGFSGSGKTTIAKLIPRFYDPQRGVIRIDGADIREVSFKSLRAQIGVVTQDTVLFNDTVRANIAYGSENYPDERIRQAAKAAHAAEFIEKLPQGYDTPIGESGGTLSGGQRQRIAIARAVIKDPAILILDEATSSLDSESERAIQAAIEEFVVGRTTLVIAHRLSTVQRADRILVIDGGELVEQGRHDELIARGGLYRRLYDVQFAGEGKARRES